MQRIRPLFRRSIRGKLPAAARISLMHLFDYAHKVYFHNGLTAMRFTPVCLSTGVSAAGAQVQIKYNSISLRHAYARGKTTRGTSEKGRVREP